MNDARGISRIFEAGQLIARCCVIQIADTADGIDSSVVRLGDFLLLYLFDTGVLGCRICDFMIIKGTMIIYYRKNHDGIF